MTSTTISLSDFAARIGRSRQAVSELVRRGKLTAFGSPPRLHLELALVEYERIRPQARNAPPAASQPSTAEPPGGAPAYGVSRARREAAAAEREHLALAREARQLLEAADVYSAVDDAAALFRAAMEDLPARLAPQLASLGNDEARIAALLSQHVEQALQSLSDRLAAVGNEPPP